MILWLLACTPPPTPAAPPPAPPIAAAAPAVDIELISMRTLDAPSFTVRFGPGGRQLATIGYPDPEVRIWSPEDGAELLNIPLRASGFDLSADGRYAVLGRKRIATVWNLERNEKVRDLGPHWDWVEAVLVHPSAHWVVTYDDTPRWHLFELETGRELDPPPAPTSLLRAAVVSSTHLSWCGVGDPAVRRWDFETGQSADLPLPHGCGDLASTPDGNVLAATLPAGDLPGKVAGGASIAVWNVREGTRIDLDGPAWQVALSPDGAILLASWEARVRVIDVATGADLGTIEAPAQVTDIAVSEDYVVAVASAGNMVSVYRLGREAPTPGFGPGSPAP